MIAAKDARIAELELSSKHSADVASNAIADMRALETQFAAAEEENRKLKRDLSIFHKDNVAFEARAALVEEINHGDTSS